MARIRVRIRINEGGEGAPLDQLADIGHEVERFLRLMTQDIGLHVPKGQWIARNFENSSVAFDSEGPAEYSLEQLRDFNATFEYISTFDPERDRLNGSVKHRTVLQFAKIADPLQPHERVSFAIYRPSQDTATDWRPLTKRRATALKERLVQTLHYVGTLQGQLHNIVVEPSLSFNIRDAQTGELVHCDADDGLYEDLRRAMARRGALLYVRGNIAVRRIDRSITAVKATAIRVAPSLTAQQYDSFFGIAPTYTGELTTEEFIDRARGYDH